LLHTQENLSKEDAGQIAKAICILENKGGAITHDIDVIIDKLSMRFIDKAQPTQATAQPQPQPHPYQQLQAGQSPPSSVRW